MMKRDTRLVFFTVGVVPSPDEIELAEKLSGNVAYRNSSVSAAGSVERADAVAALDPATIPGNYKAAYPTVNTKAEMDRLDKAIAKSVKEGTPRPTGNALPGEEVVTEPLPDGSDPARVTPVAAPAGANDASQSFNSPTTVPTTTPETAKGKASDTLPAPAPTPAPTPAPATPAPATAPTPTPAPATPAAAPATPATPTPSGWAPNA